MQCFQKDPNLRVSARKLLRHAWIAGRRRAEAPVSKAPANFNQAVEEVKQWNKALNSSDSNLRTSTGTEFTGPSSRFTGGTPAKGPLNLAKPRPGAEAFKSPELAGKFTRSRGSTGWGCSTGLPGQYRSSQLVQHSRVKLINITDDDNWDDDFATAISPSALQLPHLKPQDNFGGLLSSDKLKAFASINDGRNDSSNYDDDFEGELLTIKGPSSRYRDLDSQEHTIRPIPRKTAAKAAETPKSHHRAKSSSGKSAQAAAAAAVLSGPRSPSKPHIGSKFELPSRPDVVYREQSVEDYSDLFVDNDSVFDHRVNQAVKKACTCASGPV